MATKFRQSLCHRSLHPRSLHPRSLRPLWISLAVLVFGCTLAIFPFDAASAASTDNTTLSSTQSSGWYYRVKPGDSLSEIARRYSVTVSALAQANGLSSTSYVYVGQKLHIPAASSHVACKSYYRVKHGDTLSEIAAWYGINYYSLAQANNIGDASNIYTGQKICIPNIYSSSYGDRGKHGQGQKASTQKSHPQKNNAQKSHHSGYGWYTVQAGDSLSEIAARHGLSMHYLAKLNGIDDPSHIYVGQKLKLW